MQKTQLPTFIEHLIKSGPPPEIGEKVIASTTPVVAFGRFAESKVATVGLNPSVREFFDQSGRLLDGDDRRLATLPWLGIGSCQEANEVHINKIVAGCCDYFGTGRNPYNRWFKPLDQILHSSTGTSYFDGTACHIDLFPWASDPVWGKLSPQVRRELLLVGAEFLKALIKHCEFNKLFLNGQGVIDGFSRVFGHVARVTELNMPDKRGGKTGRICRIYRGKLDNTDIIGWSANIQSSYGVTLEFRQSLAERVKDLIHR